jgi:transcriptional regulatory protein RtcR
MGRNFRDLNAAVVRMATLAQGGRISVKIVEEEIERLGAFLGKA